MFIQGAQDLKTVKHNSMEARKKVLMIAYFFPPIGGSGTLRPLKFAKYLPSFGWTPIVLTVKNPEWYYAHDPELLKELPPPVQIERSFMFRATWLYRLLNPLRSRKIDKALRRFLIQPDDQIGWIPFAYFSGVDIIRKGCIKAVYSTSGPLSCHLIAYLLHRKTGLPWIADFRDEWFEYPDLSFPTSFHRRFHYHLEKMIVNTAHKVITPAPEFCRLLAKHCRSRDKFSTISMGYDPEDFLKHTPSTSNIDSKDQFVLAFSGLFYGSFSPINLLKALNELIEEGKVSSDRIKVKFVGANTPDDIGFEDRHGIFEFTGFVSHKQALRHLINADASLLLLSESRGKNVIPSKTFEYMASGNPILAIVPSDGDVAHIIKKTKTGVVVDFHDMKGIKRAYLQLYEQWQNETNSIEPDLAEMAKYDQKNLTKRFALLLGKIALA